MRVLTTKSTHDREDSKGSLGSARDKDVTEILNRAASTGPTAVSPLPADEQKAGGFRAAIRTIGIRLKSGLLLIAEFLIEYIPDRIRQLRSHELVVAPAASRKSSSVRSETIAAIFSELFAAFNPAQVQFALSDVRAGEIHVWQLNRSDDGRDSELVRREVDFSYRDYLFFADNNGYLLGTQLDGLEGTFQVRVFGRGRAAIEQPRATTRVFVPNRFKSFIAVPLVFGDEWEVRILLWEPAVRRFNRRAVQTVAETCNRLGPMMFAAALEEYLGGRATAEERARFARELHDGLLQSLAAVDLRMTVLAGKLNKETAGRRTELATLQEMIRGEVNNLRELIHRKRLAEIVPARLLPFLSETVRRSLRDIGVAASFICELDEVHLPPSTCYEIARIVQEALINVRKHSGAKNVAVHFNEGHGRYVLLITDDGHGFDFSGRHGFAELDAAQKGPFVIKERVRAIAGDITIESFPQRGARIEITFPMEQK